jgi:hypothetical protein
MRRILSLDALFAWSLQALAHRVAPLVWSEFERRWAHGQVPQPLADFIGRTIETKQHPLGDLGGFSVYVPNEIVAAPQPGDYMLASHPLARDFLHPEYAEFCKLMAHPVIMHRKLWEWAFIYHRLKMRGALRTGMRGLGFGVGVERLPSIFANMDIEVLATDAPASEALAAGWRANEHAAERESLFFPEHVSPEKFDRLVAFEPCDMNQIPNHLKDYDFCWSSCAFEHLGDLQRGIDFVVNSTERTLKLGGIGCHTTEMNLSSDEETVDWGGTVIYRKRDLLELCRRLEERGHRVEPLRLEPGDLPPDYLVDTPPYSHRPHLKLLLSGYITTSVGIVVTRGR